MTNAEMIKVMVKRINKALDIDIDFVGQNGYKALDLNTPPGVRTIKIARYE